MRITTKIPWLSQLAVRRVIVAALALALGTTVLGLPGESTCALAQTSCRSICLAQYNQCRISTKGSPTCDAQYQSCLHGCISARY